MPDESDRPSDFVRRLPIGKRFPLRDLVGDDLFPFEGDIAVKPLEPPILPEPERRGQGGVDCLGCEAHENDIWEDARWRVRVPREPGGLPVVAVLLPKAHHDLEDLPREVAAELGPMLVRTSRAIQRIGGIGRVHVNRWGDGSEHFHVWFLARPRGMWQLRGAMLAVWNDLLPRVPTQEWELNRRTVANALAEETGVSLI